MEVLTDRLRIRRFTAADLPAFTAYRDDPAVARYQAWATPYTADMAERFLQRQQGIQAGAPGEWLQLAVTDRADGALHGDCAVRVLADQPRTAELGVTFAPASQGRGLAAEALRAVIGAAFGELDLHRVYAEVDERNAPARRLLDQVGLRREGCLVEADWFKGEWTTVCVHALLRREWG